VFQDPTISLSVKFSVNLFNIGGVIAIWLIAKWQQQPCSILAEVNFDDKSCSGAHFRCLFQIWHKHMQQWCIYGHECDLQRGSCRHLEFCGKLILPEKPVPGPYSQCLRGVVKKFWAWLLSAILVSCERKIVTGFSNGVQLVFYKDGVPSSCLLCDI